MNALSIAAQLGLALLPKVLAPSASLLGQLAALTAPPSKRERKAPVHPYAYRMESVAQILADGLEHSTVEIAVTLGIPLDTAQKAVNRLRAHGRARRAGTIPHGKTRTATWEAVQ